MQTKSMKKLISLCLGIIIVLSSQVTVLANEFRYLPHTAPISMDLEGSNIQEALTIECMDIIPNNTNTLRIPSKRTVPCRLQIAGGIRLWINNALWHDNIGSTEEYSASYDFEAGFNYTLAIEDVNGNGGIWEILVPYLEKEAPRLQAIGPNLSEQDDILYSGGDGYLEKDLSFTITDDTGIKCVYWIPYTNDQFDTVDELGKTGIYYDDDLPDLYPTENIVFSGVTIFKKGDTPEGLYRFGSISRDVNVVRISAKKRFESNSQVLLVLEDMYGNQDSFKLVVSGINQ